MEALKTSTTASSNTAIGYEAGKLCTTGAENVFVGKGAGINVTTSTDHVFIGLDCGSTVTTGAGNTAIGKDCYKYGTGYNNVALGHNAANISSFSGNNNIVIGFDADPSAADAANEITLGNSSITKFRIPGLNSFEINDSGQLSGVTSTAVATAGVRKIHASTSAPGNSDGAVGDLWLKY